jgi:hypothetical protein
MWPNRLVYTLCSRTLGSAQFESWLGHWLSWLRSPRLSLVHPGKFQDSTFIMLWLLPSKSFSIHQSSCPLMPRSLRYWYHHQITHSPTHRVIHIFIFSRRDVRLETQIVEHMFMALLMMICYRICRKITTDVRTVHPQKWFKTNTFQIQVWHYCRS